MDLGEVKRCRVFKRKFLIERPEISELNKLYPLKRILYLETFHLYSNEVHEVSVKSIVENIGHSRLYRFECEKLSDNSYDETCTLIDGQEYNRILTDFSNYKVSINKIRYSFEHDGITFNIDTYRFWKYKAILNIRMEEAEKEFNIPEGIKVLSEVTNNYDYSDEELALNFGI